VSGHRICSTGDVNIGQVIITRFADGTVTSKVENAEKI
jgi:hypothetical protein